MYNNFKIDERKELGSTVNWQGREVEAILNNLARFANSLVACADPLCAYPDSVEMHQTQWHQYGIITHSRIAAEKWHSETKAYLAEYNLAEPIEAAMAEKIDRVSKDKLLEMALALHDIGKFARTSLWQNKTRLPNYHQHEEKSAALILAHPLIRPFLEEELKLTVDQINYIADCSRLHYKLAEIRSARLRQGDQYNLNYVNQASTKVSLEEIALNYPKKALEVGLMFLCDSLAKTDGKGLEKEMDDEKIRAHIEELNDQVKTILANREITEADRKIARNREKLMQANQQKPINIALALKYLEIAVRPRI